jgi:hypothetical protein
MSEPTTADAVEIVRSDDERGAFLRARATMGPNTAVLHVPALHVITAHAAQACLAGSWVADACMKVSAHAAIALRLLTRPEEVTLPTPNGGSVVVPSCAWAIDSAMSCLMTSPLSLNMHPDAFEAVLGMEAGTEGQWPAECLEMARKYRAGHLAITDDYRIAERVWSAQQSAPLPFGVDRFHRAVMFVRSRAVVYPAAHLAPVFRSGTASKGSWQSSISVPGLCPLIELFNHDPASRLQPEVSTAGDVAVRLPSGSKHCVSPGDEINIDYGAHDDWHFFNEYGFVPSENRNDVKVCVNVSAPAEKALAPLKVPQCFQPSAVVELSFYYPETSPDRMRPRPLSASDRLTLICCGADQGLLAGAIGECDAVESDDEEAGMFSVPDPEAESAAWLAANECKIRNVNVAARGALLRVIQTQTAQWFRAQAAVAAAESAPGRWFHTGSETEQKYCLQALGRVVARRLTLLQQSLVDVDRFWGSG